MLQPRRGASHRYEAALTQVEAAFAFRAERDYASDDRR